MCNYVRLFLYLRIRTLGKSVCVKDSRDKMLICECVNSPEYVNNILKY